MSIDINASEEHLGSLVADVSRRRGTVGEMRVRGNVRNIEGQVPLAETFGYATDLRSLTQGRGSFTLEFNHFDLMPDDLAEQVIKERREAGKIPRR